MAHMITEKDSMMYVGEKPWHGLGVACEKDYSVDNVIKKAGLNWTVQKSPLFNAQGIQYKGAYLLIRDGDHLGHCGPEYEPIQNKDAFKFFKEFTDAGEMYLETAGSIMGGRHVWGLARIEDSFYIGKKADKIQSYLLLSNPHIYGKSMMIKFTPIRVVCNNTLTMALNNNINEYIFRRIHNSEFTDDTVKLAQSCLEKSTTLMNDYKEKALLLAGSPISKLDSIQYIAAVNNLKEPEKIVHPDDLNSVGQKMYNCIDNQAGAQYGIGTWWGVFNAVTFYIDHIATRSQDQRLNSAWFGVGAALKMKALDMAVSTVRG